ncbi:MAG: hypothetical protein JWO08_1577 [Verrucomicrobiaceae bacterium]|nr:hypothetical protein [Verrucomicrobiaceae bacterium]
MIKLSRQEKVAHRLENTIDGQETLRTFDLWPFRPSPLILSRRERTTGLWLVQAKCLGRSGANSLSRRERVGVRGGRVQRPSSTFHTPLLRSKEPAQLPNARRMTQLAQRLCLDLPDAFAGDLELLAHLLQRAACAVGEAEALL